MRIRKRWPLSSHLPPITAAFPDRPPFSTPQDRQTQHRHRREEESDGKTEERSGRGLLPLHPNGDPHLLHDHGSNSLRPPTWNQHPTSLMTRRNGWIRKDEAPHPPPQALKEKEDKWVDGEKSSSSSSRTENNSSNVEKAARLMLPPFSFSHQVMEVKCEGERAFPFKKKRGVRGEDATTALKEEKITQKIHGLGDGHDDKEAVREEVEAGESKKKGRGNCSASDAIAMEGSRCSRVNGRGWRCSQQTLVGYALCEHHLGKGRLRSISSVRSRSSAHKNNHNVVGESNSNSSHSILSLPFTLQVDALGEEEDDDDDAVVKKKRKKIGMVKARSINSLLDQTHHAT